MEDKPSMLDSQDDQRCLTSASQDNTSGEQADVAGRYHDCLNKALDKSNGLLSKAFNDKLKEIRTSKDYAFRDGIAADSKTLRPKIEASFRQQQDIWLNYRDSYCKSLVIGDITGDGAFVGNIACSINMNKRRIEEINLMYNPASPWQSGEN